MTRPKKDERAKRRKQRRMELFDMIKHDVAAIKKMRRKEKKRRA